MPYIRLLVDARGALDFAEVDPFTVVLGVSRDVILARGVIALLRWSYPHPCPLPPRERGLGLTRAVGGVAWFALHGAVQSDLKRPALWPVLASFGDAACRAEIGILHGLGSD